MDRQPKTMEKAKTKSKVQIRDLKPKKDLKGGAGSDNDRKGGRY